MKKQRYRETGRELMVRELVKQNNNKTEREMRHSKRNEKREIH